MHSSVTSLLKPPYGLSFPVEELVLVRHWAEARGLCMIVALDQMLESVEFEEMLILAPPDRKRRTLTMWRTLGSVFLQVPNGRPRAFPTVQEALTSIRPAATRRSALMRLFSRS